MNGSPAGGSFRGLQMTGSGSGGTGTQPTEASNPPPSWMGQEMPSLLRPGFYPRLESSFYPTDPARLLHTQLSTTTSGSAPLVPTLSPFHHHAHPQHPSPLLPSPYHLYSPLSPGGYAHAAAAAALSSGRPPYLDPGFLAGGLPRYRYLLPGTSTAGGSRFGAPVLPQVSPSLPSPAGKIDPTTRSMSESENLARWRRPGSSPKLHTYQSGSNVVLPLIPESSSSFRPRIAGSETHSFLSETIRPVEGSGRSKSVSGPCLPTQPYYPSHFMRGTVIQLASGELKRVEDLTTEDFVRSANLSNELKMDSSTVVKIEEKTKDTVLLCFSVGEHKVQVSVEATVEHPFFVIGQGWSSCSPERTRTLYGLPCQRLQVGDICISLTHRDISRKMTAPSSADSTKTVTMVMRSSAAGPEASRVTSRKRRMDMVGERRSVPLDTAQIRKESGGKTRRWSCSY